MSVILLPPVPTTGGYVAADTTSLREIEQEVARRVGPFFLRYVQNPIPGEPGTVTSTTTQISISAIRSSITLGGLEDMYVLRRGRLRDGTLLPADDADGVPRPFAPDDRLRMVRQYVPEAGLLEVDRAYLYPTYDDEEVELHHLDPEEELRPAVLAGLRRCYLVHRQAIAYAPVGLYATIDLTAVAPWLLTRDQVYDVTAEGGASLVGWRVESYGGGLFLKLGEWALGDAMVVNRRPAPAMTLVANGNGMDVFVRAGNINEPWNDEDRFPVPLDYAAAAGHIEAWRSARPRLSAVSQIGMWAEQKEVAAEFTRVATVYFDPPRYNSGLPAISSYPFDSDLTNAR